MDVMKVVLVGWVGVETPRSGGRLAGQQFVETLEADLHACRHRRSGSAGPGLGRRVENGGCCGGPAVFLGERERHDGPGAGPILIAGFSINDTYRPLPFPADALRTPPQTRA